MRHSFNACAALSFAVPCRLSCSRCSNAALLLLLLLLLPLLSLLLPLLLPLLPAAGMGSEKPPAEHGWGGALTSSAFCHPSRVSSAELQQ